MYYETQEQEGEDASVVKQEQETSHTQTQILNFNFWELLHSKLARPTPNWPRPPG